MRMFVVALALCVAGCQFAVGGVPPAVDPGAGNPVGQPQALDGAAAPSDGGSVTNPNQPNNPPPTMPPGTPPATDCRTDGCPSGQTCAWHDSKHGFVCAPAGGGD